LDGAIKLGKDSGKKKKFKVKYDSGSFQYMYDLDPHLEDWRQLIVTWFAGEQFSRHIRFSAMNKFVQYLYDLKQPTDPLQFLHYTHVAPNFWEYLS
jgi:hypothetical protein